ncbi:hypothetical protein [Acidovorax sp.]|uniref:hypothetical protein n=1 Tax=Acidovorax sp. TaxID=1872122 RepID=UPI00391BE810
MKRVPKEKIYGAIEHALKEDWYSYWVGNGDLEKSKFNDNKFRVVDLIIPNNGRINNITLTYFPEAKQILVAQREFVEGESSTVLEEFRKSKNNPEFKRLTEKDNYGFFQRDGQVSFRIYHVKAQNGAVGYVNYGIIDVK